MDDSTVGRHPRFVGESPADFQRFAKGLSSSTITTHKGSGNTGRGACSRTGGTSERRWSFHSTAAEPGNCTVRERMSMELSRWATLRAVPARRLDEFSRIAFTGGECGLVVVITNRGDYFRASCRWSREAISFAPGVGSACATAKSLSVKSMTASSPLRAIRSPFES